MKLSNSTVSFVRKQSARVKPGSHVVQFSQGDTKKAKSFVCKPGELKVVAVSLNR